METIKVKNALNRPRVFSVVDPEGSADAIRMRSGATVNIDVRLLTPEIVANIEKGGHLLLLEGRLPARLNPYPEKKPEGATPETAHDGDGASKPHEGDGLPEDGGKKIIRKGAKG